MQRGHLLAFHPKLSTQQLLRADSRLTVPKLLSRGPAMRRRVAILGWTGLGGLCAGLLLYGLSAAQAPQTQPPSGKTYFPVVEQDFTKVRADDQAAKPAVMQRQRSLLAERYDLANRRAQAVMMSGGTKAVQQGVRVKLPGGLTWEQLAAMSPDEIREKDLFPRGFLPLPHVKHATGGMIFPKFEITEITKQEGRSLERFDADFDLPDHLLPEFPPPVFLSTRPELGDVSRGQLLTIRNYFAILDGILTPVQMEGMRLLLTPFPQQQFNQTDDRKTDVQSLGVTCLDCHSNGHTNAAFHQNPDTRQQTARLRIDTVSLSGVFGQGIHDPKFARSYKRGPINDTGIQAGGPVKTFTLRGIKDSPPYLHDGRLLTLEDTVEFFNLVLGVQLTPREKAALVAFMRQL